MTTIQRFRISPNLPIETKLNFFAPTAKNKQENDEFLVFENDNFQVFLDGYRLNQIHRDLLDIVIYFGDSSLENKITDNKAVRLFSIYQIQKKLNYKSLTNNRWIEKKFAEIQKTLIKIQEKKSGDWKKFNIIEFSQFSQKQQKYAIVFSDSFIDFFATEISICYKNYLDDIIKLNPQSKAVARYLLSSSKDFQIGFENLLFKVGIKKSKISKQAFSKIKKRVLEDEENLKKLNIFFSKQKTTKNNYLVKYEVLPKIKIFHPATKKVNRFNSIGQPI